MTGISELELDVSEEIDLVKEITRDTRYLDKKAGSVTNLYNAVVDSLSKGTMNSSQQVEYLDAFHNATALFRVTSLKLREKMDILTLEQLLQAQIRSGVEREELELNGDADPLEDEEDKESITKRITNGVMLSNRYALGFAGQVGLALLEEDPAGIDTVYNFEKRDATKDRDGQTEMLAKSTTHKLLAVVRGEDQLTDEHLKNTLKAVFTSWTNQFNWNTWKDVAESYGIDKVKLKYGNYSMLEGEFKSQCDRMEIDTTFMNVHKEDVIGNEEFIDYLWDELLMLACFDPERNENPYEPKISILTLGESGCGKTFGAHAVIRSFEDLCKDIGLPFKAVNHSPSDYASTYQNATFLKLTEQVQGFNLWPGVGVMYIADADAVFVTRDSNIRVEEQRTQQVYFKMLDGTLVDKTAGKFMVIADANYVDGIDEATKNRFAGWYHLKRFEKPKEFADLIQLTLLKGLNGIQIPEEKFLEAGEYILNETQLSNRQIDHVVKSLRGVKCDPKMVMRRASFDEHAAYRMEQINENLSGDRIVVAFKDYWETQAEIEEESLRKRRAKDEQRMLAAYQSEFDGGKSR